MDINNLLIEAGGWGRNSNNDEVMDKLTRLLYEEFQNMTLQEFKQHFRRKVTMEKKTNELVIEFASK